MEYTGENRSRLPSIQVYRSQPRKLAASSAKKQNESSSRHMEQLLACRGTLSRQAVNSCAETREQCYEECMAQVLEEKSGSQRKRGGRTLMGLQGIN